MKSFREFIDEEIKLPIEVGDIVLGGKFKNKRIMSEKEENGAK